MRSADNNGAGSPPRQHRAEVAAAEQVHVKMRHLLMGGGSGIGKDTIAAVGYPLVAADLAQGAHESGHLGRRGLLGEIVERDVLSLGDHQDMRRALRADVVEGEDVLILVNLVARDLAAQDAGEDVVVVISHCASVQRLLRARFSAMPEVPSRRASSAATSAGETPAAAHSTSRWYSRSALSPTSAAGLSPTPSMTVSIASSPSFCAIFARPRAKSLAV